MSQVVRTSNELITDAMMMVGELGVAETPDAFMLSSGIRILNEILDDFSESEIYIPFLSAVDFTMVVGKDRYSFSDIITNPDVTSDRIVGLDFANYTVQNVVYPLRILQKSAYYGVVRLDNLIARPGFIFLDKQDVESFIVLYPRPDQPYRCRIQVKLMINELLPQTNLQYLPPYYERFLRYALTRELKAWYPSGNWSPENEQEYQRVFTGLKDGNENDMTLTPTVIMNSPQPFYWPNIIAY